MENLRIRGFQKWIPAIVMMGVIFFFSSLPSDTLPQFSWFETIIYKGGHVLGYAVLSQTFVYALGSTGAHVKILAWLLAVLYGLSDEYHQFFVVGRGASYVDVLIDAIGAGISIVFTRSR